jgi:ribokinase
MDISVAVARLPVPGETVLGSGAVIAPGGKGANQAVAAARLGAVVRMAGCTGDDEFGRAARSALGAGGVDTSGVRAVQSAPTGVALITVDPAGENTIVVAPGANALVGQEELTAALAASPDLLVLSAEIPPGVLAAALAAASGSAGGAPPGTAAVTGAAGVPGAAPGTAAATGAARVPGAAPGTVAVTGAARVPCLLNLAPVPPGAADLLGAGVDWLVVNETEAAGVLGRPVAGLDGAAAAARDLRALGARHAVVTAGPLGAALDGPAGAQAVPAPSVRSVDSVGAGDAFVAALAVAIAAGVPEGEALRAACAAGATAATRRGTQDALPRPSDILAATGLAWPVTPA